jgi:hypothetical protein
MEINVGEQWRDYSALRRTAVGSFVNPIFHVARFEHSSDEIDESFIIYPSSEERQKDLMVDIVEEPTYIHFDQPFASRPSFLDDFKSRVAGTTRTEPVRLFREHGFINRRENCPCRLLDEPVFNRRDSQRPCLAVALRDMNPPDRSETIRTFRHAPGDLGQLLKRHAIEGLAISTRRQRSLIAGDLYVSPLIEIRRSHEPVKAVDPLVRPRQARQ